MTEARLVADGDGPDRSVTRQPLHALAGHRRMTQGRRGSLALRRRALPSPPPGRFIPALSGNPPAPAIPPRPARQLTIGRAVRGALIAELVLAHLGGQPGA